MLNLKTEFKLSINSPGWSNNSSHCSTKTTETNTKLAISSSNFTPYGATLMCTGFWRSIIELSAPDCQANRILSRQELINCGLQSSGAVTEDFHWTNSFPVDRARPAGSPWIVVSSYKRRRWRESKLPPEEVFGCMCCSADMGACLRRPQDICPWILSLFLPLDYGCFPPTS